MEHYVKNLTWNVKVNFVLYSLASYVFHNSHSVAPVRLGNGSGKVCSITEQFKL